MSNFALIDFGKLGPAIVEQLEAKGHACRIVISESTFREQHYHIDALFISVEELFESPIVTFGEKKLKFYRDNYEWVRRCAQRWIVGEINHDDFFYATFKSFCFCCEKLDDNGITVAFSGTSSPHHLYNLLFYLATVYLRIKHYFLSQIFINNRLNIVEGLGKRMWPTAKKFNDHTEIHDFVNRILGQATRPRYVSEYLSLRYNPIGKIRFLSSAYSLAKTLRSLVGLIIKRKKLVGICLFPLNRSYSFFYSLKCWRSRRRIAKLKRNYNKLVISELPKRFVLVLGPYQPEATSQPDAEGYADVRIMLLHLRSRVSQDIAIVYKEHPTMFLYHILGFDATIDDHRSELFYSDIASLGIKFADNLLDAGQLIDNAEFVVGINGTFAIEAALKGRVSFVYGNTWYGSLPFVRRVDYDSDFKSGRDSAMRHSVHEVVDHLCSLNENSLPNIVGVASMITQTADVMILSDELDRILRYHSPHSSQQIS